MPTIEALRRQLGVAVELHSVVTTMKALAAVELREYERVVRAMVESVRVIQLGFQILFRHHPEMLLDDVPESDGLTLAVVFGSDQGLCGPLNRIITRTVLEEVDPHELIAVGLRVGRELEVVGRAAGVTSSLPSSVGSVAEAVRTLLVGIDRFRQTNDLRRVVIVHARPEGRLGYLPRVSTIVPSDPKLLRAIARRPWPTRNIPALNGDPHSLLGALTRQAVSYSLHRAFIEARASEHAARLIAMQNAEQSIAERVEDLTRAMHRARQSSITAELLDVVAGSTVAQTIDQHGAPMPGHLMF